MQAWSRSASRRLTYQLAVSLRLRRDSISLPIVIIQASHKRPARQMTYSRLRSQYNPTSNFRQCNWQGWRDRCADLPTSINIDVCLPETPNSMLNIKLMERVSLPVAATDDDLMSQAAAQGHENAALLILNDIKRKRWRHERLPGIRWIPGVLDRPQSLVVSLLWYPNLDFKLRTLTLELKAVL